MTHEPSDEAKAAWRHSRQASLYEAQCAIEAHLALQAHEVDDGALDEDVLAYCDGLKAALRIIRRLKETAA
jgi:hypothetical protein